MRYPEKDEKKRNPRSWRAAAPADVDSRNFVSASSDLIDLLGIECFVLQKQSDLLIIYRICCDHFLSPCVLIRQLY